MVECEKQHHRTEKRRSHPGQCRGIRSRLKSIDLSIAEGEAVGIVGPSGSGKSTLLMVLAGLERLDTGEIHVRDTHSTP